MARLRGTDRYHLKRSRRLLDQLARELEEAENSAQCRRNFETRIRAAETAGRLGANVDALEAESFDSDDAIFERIDLAQDVTSERGAEFAELCLREATSRGR